MTMANGKKIIIESVDGTILDTSHICDDDLDVSQLSAITDIIEKDDAIHIVIANSAALSALLEKLSRKAISSGERHY